MNRGPRKKKLPKWKQNLIDSRLYLCFVRKYSADVKKNVHDPIPWAILARNSSHGPDALRKENSIRTSIFKHGPTCRKNSLLEKEKRCLGTTDHPVSGRFVVVYWMKRMATGGIMILWSWNILAEKAPQIWGNPCFEWMTQRIEQFI